ncbi:MAG: SDR family NAD(P)-dependent oxidoreductase [Candidatus Methylomirabilis sp.]|nr:SDR family NAD(P)-dependent oxidoreductase [Deltaproteobacteria bacterium]
MEKDFEGRRVVVTGGTGALGSAVVGALADRGAACVIPGFDEAEFARFPHKGRAGVSVVRNVDLRDEASVRSFYDALPDLWASVHVAGGFAMSPIAETTLADYRAMMEMNATTCFLCCREAVRRIRAGGGGGRIVNVAARPALVPAAGMIPYSASKAAVAAITQALADEVRGEGIWVNAVVPSIMDTPANRAAMPDADHAQWPSAAAAAETIAFLASPRNEATRGGLVPVYGRS